ncbi:PIN domain-containing protein [soil metagenome]
MRVFLDTGALLALSHARDQYHQRATAIARRHHAAGGQYVSSTLVLGEFHSHLLYLRGPAAALAALTSLIEDPAHEWTAVPADLLRDARTKWLARFADQRFSLTDAVSFEIMSRDGLSHAFAFDQHFETAGFALLQ